MAKDFFSVDRTTKLGAIPKDGRIHVIGVSGVAMAQLSMALAKAGYRVSGSDKDFYEPMGGLLRSSPVELRHGYDASHVPLDADLVIIGNAVSYGNPEVDVVEQKNLPYACFPQMVDDLLIGGRHSVVLSGTHGKSTTTALVASMLVKLGLEPSYFIGGASKDLPDSLAVGAGKHCVLEGDEYDSAFFAKVPKFAFYHPTTCVVNAVEFDHADIYPDLKSINREFTKLVESIPAEGHAICCIDFPNLEALVSEWRKSAKCKIITFGSHQNADVRIENRETNGPSQVVHVQSKSLGAFTLKIPLIGAFNAKNALACFLVAECLGIDRERALEVIATFKPVKRRQEIRHQGKRVVLIEDFAHHPTAVRETIQGVREAFPNHKLWAVFEPRSNTSRRRIFQQDYINAFNNGDAVILCEVASRSIDSGHELLDVNELATSITASGTPTQSLPDAAAIQAELLKKVGDNDVIVVMSNGAFGGLPQNLENALKEGGF